MRYPLILVLLAAVACACGLTIATSEAIADDLADDLVKELRRLDSRVLEDDSARNTFARDIARRLQEANQRSTKEWNAIGSREEWERFRDQRIADLRASMRVRGPGDEPLNLQVRGQFEHDDYVVRKITYQSPTGLLVTANLYAPLKPESAPGILLSHSHHAPKSQRELQEMGALWARAGCYVLVPDHLGHGERRQHPFRAAEDYAESFQPDRQDYYFRFNTAMQLYVAGESLMGWMVHDLVRGVDMLLAQEGIDARRIAIFGGVAGGGDPAAVAAAIDARVALLVPFNFGGPQPENRYPLPDDAEQSFPYAGSGSWESTRNLHRSAADGFLPWVIVGSLAPRRLIHAHEFAWDRERDPVWKRYERIFAWYDAGDRLGFTHGYGLLRESADKASHCGNIGRPHRERMHHHLSQWWGITVDEEAKFVRHSAAELACLEPDESPTPVFQLAAGLARERTTDFANRIADRDRGRHLLAAWNRAFEHDSSTTLRAIVESSSTDKESLPHCEVQRVRLRGESGPLPVLLLLPKDQERKSVVLVLCQSGKAEYMQKRSAMIAQLLEHAAVCIVDLRGTGETSPGNDRGRRSATTSLAASELMLGRTMLGERLHDARTVLHYLRTGREFDRIALLGDSLSDANGNDAHLERPLEVEQPHLAEPLGPTLALLLGLYEEKPLVIAVRGGLVSYASLLESPFLHVPFDAIVPGAATAGDLPLAAEVVQSMHRVRISGAVDGRNRPVDFERLQREYGAAAHRDSADAALTAWLLESLREQRRP
jgi:dienelactone hydrolase